MKRLSLNRHKKSSNDDKQAKISNFFFKSPEPAPIKEDVIPKTPEDENFAKKRKLFKLKKHTSKVAFFGGASTTSVVAGNLDTKASKVHSPPKFEESKKRPLTPENRYENFLHDREIRLLKVLTVQLLSRKNDFNLHHFTVHFVNRGKVSLKFGTSKR